MLSEASYHNMTVGRIPSVEGGIQPTIFDAKGDLLTATANDTPARLAVGANNTLLTADSTAATGVKWAGAWTTWTPTISNLTIGNGTITARYARVGNTVNFSLKVLFGSTTSISGSPYFTLPINAASTASMFMTIIDAGVANYYGGAGIYSFDFSQCFPDAINSSGTYASNAGITATVPFTWGNGDYYHISGTYETA